MLNPKKEAETLKVGPVELGQCPACSSLISHIYFMQDADTKKQSKWYSCSCGVVWNTEKPTKVYDRAYWDKYDQHDKKLRDAYEYPIRIYAPLIEELIYGRRVLIVGAPTAHQEEAFARRGWIPYSIDKNTSLEPSERFFVGDFEDYPFPEGLKFDLIWIYHTLECFSDPIASLSRMSSLLTEDTILFIASPDTDFIHTRGSSGFRHWKPDTNYLMWNRRSITKQLDKLGFNVIMARQNCWQRFPETDDFHLIAQRKFF